jgi:site-specific DNA-methyltransferase (adenine-specific)
MSEVKLILGDCLEAMRGMPDASVGAIVTDPPYGVGHATNYGRFTGQGNFAKQSRDYLPIEGDDSDFDPSPFLRYPKVILWGFNAFSDKLPKGSVLVWCKRRDSKIGKFLSDCELAWMKGGYGVYLFHHIWDGFDRETERGRALHPSQKPVALMRWCIERLRLPPSATVFDPYMGSGATGVAAVQLGFNFIGVEKDAGYFAIAERRIAEAKGRAPLFAEAVA